LPWGSRTARFSTGQKVDIPLLVRRQRHADIIKMFRKTTGGKSTTLSDSTMERVLQSCSASRSKAVVCMNYFEAAGQEVSIL